EQARLQMMLKVLREAGSTRQACAISILRCGTGIAKGEQARLQMMLKVLREAGSTRQACAISILRCGTG
ncbi:hypothetical protein CQA72_29670, partial [Klebsiella pneumoniae]